MRSKKFGSLNKAVVCPVYESCPRSNKAVVCSVRVRSFDLFFLINKIQKDMQAIHKVFACSLLVLFSTSKAVACLVVELHEQGFHWLGILQRRLSARLQGRCVSIW